MQDGFRLNMRSDGRTNTQSLPYSLQRGTVEEAFGSCTVTFGEQQTRVTCAIKAEIGKPLPAEPDKGVISFHVESSQTGSS